MDEFELWIAPARLGQKTLRGVISFRRKTIRVQPRDLASAAAADVGGQAARGEKALDDVMEIGWRRLLVPVFCERGSVFVVGRECATIQTLALDPGKVRDGARRGANFVEQSQAIFAHFRIVVIDLGLVKER